MNMTRKKSFKEKRERILPLLRSSLPPVRSSCPIYWMVNMSFKTNEEILSSFSFPQHFTWDNYKTIFTDESWYSGYINSLIYVASTR